MRKAVAVNSRGNRVGQDHHNAVLTDHEIELVRALHDSGLGYRRIADKMGLSKSAVAKICRYERRAVTVAGFRRVPVGAVDA